MGRDGIFQRVFQNDFRTILRDESSFSRMTFPCSIASVADRLWLTKALKLNHEIYYSREIFWKALVLFMKIFKIYQFGFYYHIIIKTKSFLNALVIMTSKKNPVQLITSNFACAQQVIKSLLHEPKLVQISRRGSRPWRKWLEPRSDFFHLGIFCINLFEDIRLNILRFTLYSYNNKNLGNFMSYFF